MPTDPFIDVSTYDLDRPTFDRDAVYDLLPHRHELEQLSGVLDVNYEENALVGFTRYPENAFWARGHIPGHPLLPGVLMVEAAAQLGVFYCLHTRPDEPGFWALAGVDKVRYRGSVRPGDTVIYVDRMTQMRSRVIRFLFQGIKDGEVIVEGEITGMRVPGIG